MKLIQMVGGYSNAFTSFDQTVYVNTVPSNQTEMALYLEGSRKENNLTTQAGQFYKKTYTVRVTDGQLTVRLTDSGGQNPEAVINALEFNRTGN